MGVLTTPCADHRCQAWPLSPGLRSSSLEAIALLLDLMSFTKRFNYYDSDPEVGSPYHPYQPSFLNKFTVGAKFRTSCLMIPIDWSIFIIFPLQPSKVVGFRGWCRHHSKHHVGSPSDTVQLTMRNLALSVSIPRWSRWFYDVLCKVCIFLKDYSL